MCCSSGLATGTILKRADITFQRPGDGLPPYLEEFLVGLQLTQPVQKYQKLSNQHFNV